eukprot:GHVR01019746.1.p1 GENE.GHVR01019746.1~~GHVR01019746.1.p1  ORF type:complete len:166 (+),score=45.46 GHVR01019746.1:150-647(+)
MNKIGAKVDLKILNVKSVEIEDFILILGARRGQSLQEGETLRKLSLGTYVIVGGINESTHTQTHTQQKKQRVAIGMEAVEGWLHHGSLVLVDVNLVVDQSLSIKAKDGTHLFGSSEVKETSHLLRFESQLKLGHTHTQASCWELVDMNFTLEGNFPVKSNDDASN